MWGRCQGVRDSCPISEMGGGNSLLRVLGALLAAQGGGAWGGRGMQERGCFPAHVAQRRLHALCKRQCSGLGWGFLG